MAKKKELIMVGIVDAEGYELDNRVYSAGGHLRHRDMATQESVY